MGGAVQLSNRETDMTQAINEGHNLMKVHFKSAKQAMAASVDGSCWAANRDASGRAKSWVAHVLKVRKQETHEEVVARTAGALK
jgi:hypothetical protein